MRSHDAVIVDGADNATLAAVMGSPVIVNLDACVEMKPGDQALRIEHRIEIHPGATVRGPWAAHGHNAAPLVANITLRLPQVFAQARVAIEFLQFVFKPRAPIENAQ